MHFMWVQMHRMHQWRWRQSLCIKMLRWRTVTSISPPVPDRCLKYIGEQTPVVRVSPVGPAHQIASATGGFQRRCYRRREALRVLLVEEGCVRSGDGMRLGVVIGGMETPDDYEIVRRRRCHLLEKGAPPSGKISLNAELSSAARIGT